MLYNILWDAEIQTLHSNTASSDRFALFSHQIATDLSLHMLPIPPSWAQADNYQQRFLLLPLKVSRGSAYRMELTPEEMFLHYLDLILMALDLSRSLMKLMQLFNENWIRQSNWTRLCNDWRASKTIPLLQGECHLYRLVRNKLPLL